MDTPPTLLRPTQDSSAPYTATLARACIDDAPAHKAPPTTAQHCSSTSARSACPVSRPHISAAAASAATVAASAAIPGLRSAALKASHLGRKDIR